MSCPSHKNEYYSQALAEEQLIDLHARNNYANGDGPVNVYMCDICHHWHLTSTGGLNLELKEQMENGELKKKQTAYQWENKL
ncbi:MAG: hypothetical protein KJO64_05850 [Bacteroidia bacterium]|nr:hypothetical protein [Bacteroidia bacterium]NNC85866.1 hypothetical protein [Bacteroidia bacterium]